jgi:rubrerythrin
MEGIQKLKCSSCGTTFMSETSTTKCPSCSEKESQGAGNTGGCGCGHQH